MTAQKKFKQAVRERMARTGESYTAARLALEDGRRPKVRFEPATCPHNVPFNDYCQACGRVVHP